MSEPLIIRLDDSKPKEVAAAEAAQLQTRFSIPVAETSHHDDRISIGWHTDKKDQQNKLALFSQNNGPVFIDFLTGKKAHRRLFGGGKGQPLVRAMGKSEKPEQPLRIIDATAGMGGDSFVLASQGFDVHMLERSQAVAALLEDALARAHCLLLDKTLPDHEALSAIIERLSLTHCDAAMYIAQLPQSGVVDVVYMDPMYPEKKKKAATNKEMQTLQQLVGADKDSEQLLTAALQKAKSRVVVKRPKGAPIIQHDNPKIIPTTAISSPNTRYDIYVIKTLAQYL